ncbi:MAG: LysM peptidoglycan-binding domain-containing protein [Deltaproteobacteria bacterium]|nr:LysM peptidoglycan-binding domain-containing protein [Deltaproteobacteria bacterium]
MRRLHFFAIGLISFLALAACGGPKPDSAIGRQANMVAREGRAGSHKYYRLGPRFEKQLNQMVDQEFLAIAGRKEDVPLELNQEVLINLNYFLNDARGFITRSLNRGQKYIPIMKAILRQKGLPEDLVYLALIESGYRTEAVSRASAVGPWQFIAPTGRRYGLTINEWVDERMDPIKSTYAAADYLITLYEMFHSWPLAIAAYNSGEGKILKGMLKPEVDNYWDMAKADGFLAAETKRYVPSFLAAAIIAKDPLAYGLEVESAQVDTWDEVVVPQPIDLAMAARLSGTNLERIKELNPHLKRMATPPSEQDFILRVPQGSSEVFYQLYAQLPEAQRSNRVIIHLAKRGDTVESVANHYRLTPEVVRQYNNLSMARLKAGQRLVLPASMSQAPGVQEPLAVASVMRTSRQVVSPAVVVTRREFQPKPIIQTRAVTPVLATVSSKSRQPVIATVRHRTRAGETLGELARRYGTTTEKLRADNRLGSNNLREGQVLVVSSNLPVPTAALPRSKTTWVEETEGEPVYYLVKAGDTLGTIADIYKTSPEQLRTLNSLPNSNILAGQKLVVGSGPARSSQTASVERKGSDLSTRSAPSSHVVSSGDTISQIAARYQMTSQELMDLNKLHNDRVSPGQKLRVRAATQPAQAAAAVARSSVSGQVLGDASRVGQRPSQKASQGNIPDKSVPASRAVAGEKSSAAFYEVVSGDTISQIAENHHLTSAELRELNHLSGDQLRVGQKLQVSVKGKARVESGSRSAKSSSALYEVAKGDTVSQIAERHQMTSAELKSLNNLTGDQLRVGQKLKVASVTRQSENRATAKAAPQTASKAVPKAATKTSATVYEVTVGDTVSQIASRHNMTTSELRELNNLTNDQIKPGQKLKVKGQTSPAKPASPTGSATSSKSSTQTSAGQFYIVEVGDTLASVAAYLKTTPAQLRTANKLTSDRLSPGLKLIAPSRSSVSHAKGGSYQVKDGDSLYSVARAHNLTVDQLKKLNGKKDDDLKPGQNLKVK